MLRVLLTGQADDDVLDSCTACGDVHRVLRKLWSLADLTGVLDPRLL